MKVVGLVLAGGKSRRFGSEKAMAVFEGETLIARAVARLRAQGMDVAVNAAPGSGAAEWARGERLACLNDDPANPAGPLAGVKAGLGWARESGADVLVTSPCDTPFLPHDLERSLLDLLSPTAGAATVRTPSGLQTLCAAWGVTPTLDRLTAFFARGEHPPVHRVLEELGAAELCFADEAAFANINTQGDLSRASESDPA